MVKARSLGSALLLASVSQAQVVSYSSNGYGISVNIPSSSTSGSGPIFMQISAPGGTQWVGFGQGSRMSNANMFLIYSAGDGNVTLSPRSAPGEVMPTFKSSSQVTLLEGSGVGGDGSLIANIRCDNCLGDVMSATSSSSNWIHSYKTGSSLDSTDQSASISQHDAYNTFNLDLTQGTGGSSSNPFVQQSPSGTSAGSPSSTQASSSATKSVSAPLASSNPNTTDDPSVQTDGSDVDTLTLAHGVIMSLLFLGLFPFSSLTLYLGVSNRVRYIHGPLQLFNTILLIVGLALGIKVGQEIEELDQYHQIIGYIVVVVLVVFQPALGIIQHLRYRKDGSKTVFGVTHRWLGRGLLILGLINGGLGWQIAGTTSAYIPYAVIAAIVGVIYIGVVVWMALRAPSPVDIKETSPISSSYEMKHATVQHQRLASDEHNNMI